MSIGLIHVGANSRSGARAAIPEPPLRGPEQTRRRTNRRFINGTFNCVAVESTVCGSLRDMRRFLTRVLIFALLGPAATYASIYLTVRTAERWWWPEPSIYLVELTPFLLCAFVDGTLKYLSVLRQLILPGSAAFITSSLACALVYSGIYGGFSAWVFARYTPVIAAACSVFPAETILRAAVSSTIDNVAC